jgi:hypothetical protein
MMGFARIEIQMPDDVEWDSSRGQELLRNLCLLLGLADVKDCSHKHRVPDWFMELLALPPVEAWVLGFTSGWYETPFGQRYISPTDLLVPGWGMLPMGCQWSLFLAQEADAWKATMASSLKCTTGEPCLQPLHDRGDALVVEAATVELFYGGHPETRSQSAHYVCVDNLKGLEASAQRGTFTSGGPPPPDRPP